ncbi:MAG: hypothetical protein SAL70_15510 [Scytonema sp. PMC 1070.18]|nr:hypothetical protein [Scytonema sp. PMC 1070.18]
MITKSTVLVVGSTGMLGFKIVSALLNKGDTYVKAMVRSRSTEQKARTTIKEEWLGCLKVVGAIACKFCIDRRSFL